MGEIVHTILTTRVIFLTKELQGWFFVLNRLVSHKHYQCQWRDIEIRLISGPWQNYMRHIWTQVTTDNGLSWANQNIGTSSIIYDQSAWTVIKKSGQGYSVAQNLYALFYSSATNSVVPLNWTSCSRKVWAQFMDWSIGTWFASLSLLTQAGGGNTASYFGESKIPFSKSLLKSSPTYGVPCFGGKNAQVFKCLLLVIITAFLTETLSWRAINWGVCDVGRRVHGVTVLAHLAHLVLL